MAAVNSREKLEQELRFLKESFDAEVISKDEYERGKGRVEVKLKEFDTSSKTPDKQDEINTEEIKEEPEQKEEQKSEPKEEIKEEKKEEKPEPKKKDEEKSEDFDRKEKKETVEKKEKPEKTVSEDGDTDEEEQETGKKNGRFWTYFWAILVLIVLLFGAYVFLSRQAGTNGRGWKNIYSSDNATFLCISDSDCAQTGKIGKCVNPSTKDAKCEFKDIEPLKVIVVNAKECFNCDLSRVLSILNDWVGPVEAVEVDYQSEQGKELLKNFNVEILPYYIVDEKIAQRGTFAQYARAFSAKNNSYILS